MEEEKRRQLAKAGQQFAETIAQLSGRHTIIAWGTLDERPDGYREFIIGSGFSTGKEKIDYETLDSLAYRIIQAGLAEVTEKYETNQNNNG